MRDVGVRSVEQLGRSGPVVAEARGDWRMVVLADQAGYSGICIGDADFDESFGSANRPTDVTPPAPRQLAPISLGESEADATTQHSPP